MVARLLPTICNISAICILGENSMKPTRIPSLKRKQISDTLGNKVPDWYTFSLLFDWKNIFDLDAKKPQPSDSKEKFSEIQALRSKYEKHEAHWCLYVGAVCLLDKRSANLELVTMVFSIKTGNLHKVINFLSEEFRGLNNCYL